MNGSLPVVVVSNDVVPGLGLPVAAPGLRAFGLAEGLQAHGVSTRVVVPGELVRRQWARLRRPVPQPAAPGVDVVGTELLGRYVGSHAPAAVVMINSNQIDYLEPAVPGVRYVMDFFAPKVLEMVHGGEAYSEAALEKLRGRKLRAIRMADAFIANGAKKVPYFRDWLSRAGREDAPLEVVNMCVPPHVADAAAGREAGQETVRLAMTGYLQAWSVLGDWVGVLERFLERPGVGLDVLYARHWGGAAKKLVYGSQGDLDRLGRHGSVTVRGPMRFSDFRRFLSGVDVSLDLFEHTREREYAMVTRTVVSLACGVPVVHPPFTEASPLISRYDAGWLVEPRDAGAVEAVLEEIVGDPDAVRRKAENARALAKEVFDPAVAVRPLLGMLSS